MRDNQLKLELPNEFIILFCLVQIGDVRKQMRLVYTEPTKELIQWAVSIWTKEAFIH